MSASEPRPPKVWRQGTDQQPEPPKQGIPPQRTPRWLARALVLLVYPFMMLDLLIQSLIRHLYPPPYKLMGQCKKRGNCCHYIFMEWPPILDKWPWFGRFWMWWYTDVQGFFVRNFDFENDDGRVAKVMSCRHLRTDGSCGNYLLRPAICRQWPRQSYTLQPHMLKGCGYFAIPRDAEEPPSLSLALPPSETTQHNSPNPQADLPQPPTPPTTDTKTSNSR